MAELSNQSQQNIVSNHQFHPAPCTSETIAMGLLYCGRHEDTAIIQSTTNKFLRAIVINMDNYPMVKKPIGHIPYKSTPGGPLVTELLPMPCRRLVLLYFKSAKDEDLINLDALAVAPSLLSSQQLGTPSPAMMAGRNISESLAWEKNMLSFVNLFAILPLP